MNNLEIEIQVIAEKIEPLIEFLKNNGTFVSENRQLDDYFVPAHRDFLKERPLREWLRLRNSEGAFSINYKNWHYDENSKSLHYCDEFESLIQDLETMRKVLGALDFKPVATVDKTRKIWTYNDYEIAIDSVIGLGDSVEIEYKGSGTADQEKVVEEMINFLKKLGCGQLKISNDGYPFRLLFPEEAKFEIID